MDAFAAAAGFKSTAELMQSPGAGAFVRASMQVVLEQLEQEEQLRQNK